MTSIQEEFDKACQDAKKLPSSLPNEDRLYFYSHFKQATEGDISAPRPGMLDFTGKAKWDAWNQLKGMDKNDAMTKYLEKFRPMKDSCTE
ncbi:hypothetical protein CYMTET_40773 [Cymbomonas tetramitiformis]|uniref:Acyl-CoA-binding protein n=1 Tax=Cymbomonas tetramitiformis TaxID=36881 RepID=A0AAE0F2L8_9CHLO|nr:hypothetical protein CYMTET_40773 [Cymbomonas tetramitiformis]